MAGLSLLLSPSLEKREQAELQDALLESIEGGNGSVLMDSRIANEPVDYYGADTAVNTEPEAGGEIQITGIGTLSIDRIDLRLPVTEGATHSQLKISVCHVAETAGIGETGNAVVAGHRSYTYGHLFNRLDELEEGDVISFTGADGEEMRFTVTGKRVVTPEDETAFHQPTDRRLLTLYTCTPIHTATHRLLVLAEMVEE